MIKSPIRIQSIPNILPKKLLQASRAELLNLEVRRAENGSGWGFFPGIESGLKNGESNLYPETIRLGIELKESLLPLLSSASSEYRLAFIKQSKSEVTAFFGGLHLDPDPSLQEDEEIERILINLHSSPRQIRFAHSNRFELAQLGVEMNRHSYKQLNLPSSIETSIVQIPQRTDQSLYSLTFLASQIPHVGVTNTDGHFIASFERKISIESSA